MFTRFNQNKHAYEQYRTKTSQRNTSPNYNMVRRYIRCEYTHMSEHRSITLYTTLFVRLDVFSLEWKIKFNNCPCTNLFGDNEFFTLVPDTLFRFFLWVIFMQRVPSAYYILLLLLYLGRAGATSAARKRLRWLRWRWRWRRRASRKQPCSPLTLRIIMFLINVSHCCARRGAGKTIRRNVSAPAEGRKNKREKLYSAPSTTTAAARGDYGVRGSFRKAVGIFTFNIDGSF